MKRLALFFLLAEVPAMGAEDMRTIQLSCTYVGSASGTSQITIVDNGKAIAMTDGMFNWFGRSNPYVFDGTLEPPKDLPKKVSGLIKIDRTTGRMEKILFAEDGPPLSQEAICEPAKPKF